jgi:hypothetical protein
MQEALRLRSQTLWPPPIPISTGRITSFFAVLPFSRETERQIDNKVTLDPRSVRPLEGGDYSYVLETSVMMLFWIPLRYSDEVT